MRSLLFPKKITFSTSAVPGSTTPWKARWGGDTPWNGEEHDPGKGLVEDRKRHAPGPGGRRGRGDTDRPEAQGPAFVPWAGAGRPGNIKADVQSPKALEGGAGATLPCVFSQEVLCTSRAGMTTARARLPNRTAGVEIPAPHALC